MPFSEDICVIVVCDGCGDGWADEACGEPHFVDYDSARVYIVEHGWSVDGARLVCPDCTRLEACAARGHAWGPWRVVTGLKTTGGTWSGRVRSCAGCPDSQWDPALTPAASAASVGAVSATVGEGRS